MNLWWRGGEPKINMITGKKIPHYFCLHLTYGILEH